MYTDDDGRIRTPHAHIRGQLAELVADWADQQGFNADISLSRIDRISFSFTDDNGDRWHVTVHRA